MVRELANSNLNLDSLGLTNFNSQLPLNSGQLSTGNYNLQINSVIPTQIPKKRGAAKIKF